MSLAELTKKAEAAEKWEPPQADKPALVTVAWGDSTWEGAVTLLSPSKKLTRDRVLAGFFSGLDIQVEFAPRYRYWLALATIRVMWPDLPKWLDWLVTNHEDTALDLLERVEGYEATFRERARIQGPGTSGAPVVSART